jgi:DNA-directed RNA polymerase III subunit RPC8
MFVVTSLVDVIRIPPSLLGGSCRNAIISEIDHKYPNRVLLDHGLVISRYGEVKDISDGVCVAGDGGSHHTCAFSLIVFRPFLEEVVIGRITKSTAEGVHVTLGFFDNVFIPAYWMLRPSVYEPELGLWVWTPRYDDDDEDDDNDETGDGEGKSGEENGDSSKAKEPGSEERYEMVLHAEIRFKVKSIQYTQLTKTVKGLQATTTTDDSSGGGALLSASSSSAASATAATSSAGLTNIKADLLALGPIRRQRSSTMDESTGLASASASSSMSQGQSPMYIIGSICEDGLGLTSWWTNAEGVDEGDDDDDEDDGAAQESDEGCNGGGENDDEG